MHSHDPVPTTPAPVESGAAATRSLPAHPDPEQLRRQAKELLRAWRAADPLALARAAPFALAPPPRLAQAQLVLARERGLPSWPALMAEVERRRTTALNDAAFTDQVLASVIGRGYDAPRPKQALAALQARPGTRPVALQLVLGELAAPWRHDLPVPPWNSLPLVLVAFSSLATVGCEAALCTTLAQLLAEGADPNAGLTDPASPGQTLPALYGAVARARSAAMVQLLLDAGAEPNDGESLYHAVECDDRRIVAALVAAGARWTGTNALHRQLDFESLPHLRQVLALGADPNETLPPGGLPPLQHAVRRGRSLDCLQLLVDHGADVAALDSQGHKLAWVAARAGRRDVLAWLAGLGQLPPAGLQERFLAACAAADELAARALLVEQPQLVDVLSTADRQLLPEQAQRGELASVRLMLELGWPVDVPGPWQASALNQAAFRGDARMVALLLRHGARWHERNGYGGTALGSCLHAGCNEPVAGGDYAGVLKLLLADGAPAPADDGTLSDELSAALHEN